MSNQSISLPRPWWFCFPVRRLREFIWVETEGNAGKESRTCFVRAATFGRVRGFLLQAPGGVDEKLDDDAYSLGWLEQAVVRVRVYDYHAYTDRVAMCPAWCIFGSSSVPDAYLGILFLYRGPIWEDFLIENYLF
jgi:hypothetical protein